MKMTMLTSEGEQHERTHSAGLKCASSKLHQVSA